MKLKHNCPKCNRPVDHIRSETSLGTTAIYTYSCGHLETRKKFSESDLVSDHEVSELIRSVANDIHKSGYIQENYEDFEINRFDSESPAYIKAAHEIVKKIPEAFWSVEIVPEYFCEECKEFHVRKHLYPFQRDGVEFIRKSRVNSLIADEMGLGKTPQSVVAIKALNLFPCLVVVKGATLFQWPREIQSWATGEADFMGVMPISSRNSFIKGFKFYVISMDFLSRKGILESIKKLGIKSIIVDECHNFKDASSARTKALIQLIQDNEIEYKVMLSGTPVLNRAEEYFVTLNMLAPAHFTSKAYFCNNWLQLNDKGAYSRVKSWMEDEFKELISRWVIRREQKDVQKDLPPLRINYQMVEIEDEFLRKSYNHQLDLFNNFLRNTARVTSQDILGWLAKLRAITGQAKCKNAVEFVEEFYESNDTDKIAVGIHHHSVRDTLRLVFEGKGYNPLVLSGEDSNWHKTQIIKEFTEDPTKRSLIINMVAGGVGLNIQCCNNFLALERQWNGALEDQFHKRFHRDGQKKSVLGTYLIAAGTIDEWFHKLVYEKRINTASAGVGEIPKDFESVDFLREFSEIVVSNRL